MIPADPKQLDQLRQLAERNIANGDWGDEVSIPGIPGEEKPQSPTDRAAKATVAKTLAKARGQKLPKRR